jgi:ABC-2 type transporter
LNLRRSPVTRPEKSMPCGSWPAIEPAADDRNHKADVLHVPIAGSMTLFGTGAVLYVVSVAALGILLATFTGTMGQFGLLALPVMIALNLLSGSITPMESMPKWPQDVMQVTPTTHFVSFAFGGPSPAFEQRPALLNRFRPHPYTIRLDGAWMVPYGRPYL